MVNRTDSRLRAAELTEEEFLGTIERHSDTAVNLLDAYREWRSLWARLPDMPLMEPHDGYSLRYDSCSQLRLVFLVCNDELVGVYHDDNFAMDPATPVKGLSHELILAAFAQVPWKNIPNRKVTNAGETALRRAHKFVRDIVRKLEGE